MCLRVSVEDAAKEIGCDKQFLKRQMQKKDGWDLGSYVPPEKGQKKGTYLIFRPKLNKFLGLIESGEPVDGVPTDISERMKKKEDRHGTNNHKGN